MIYEVLFNKLVDKAISLGLTREQVREVTKEQVANFLDEDVNDPRWSGGNIGLFQNLRENVAREIEAKIIRPKIAEIKTAIEVIFPNAEYTVKRRQKIVTIFLEGKPESDDGLDE